MNLALSKMKLWHWVLLAVGVLILVTAAFGSLSPLWAAFTKGDVGKEVRAEYALRKAGGRLTALSPSTTSAPTALVAASPSPTPEPTPAVSKGTLTIAAVTPTPATPDSQTLDLTRPDGQLVPPSAVHSNGPKEDLNNIPGRPGSSANFQPGARRNNDAALVVGTSTDGASPPVPDSLLNQGYPGTTPTANNATVPNTTTVVDPRRYLFNNQSPDAVAGNTVVISDDNGKDFSIAGFAPEGSTIQLCMLQAVSSADMELDVKAAVIKPFIFQGHQLLAIGDQLLGKASSSNKRDRILVTWHTIIYPSGMSTAIDAIAQDPSGQIGVPGVQIGSRIMQSITPVLLDTAGAFVQAFRQQAFTTIIPSNLSVGSVTVTNSNLTAETQLTDAGLSAVQGGLNKISELIAEDVEANKPYIFIMPGVLCQAYLRKPLDVTKRGYGN